MASPSGRITEVERTQGGTFPVGTCGVLIERLIPTPGHKGGHREYVVYVSPAKFAVQLSGLPPGRYRVACVGARGFIAGGTRVVEVQEGVPAKRVPARTPKDYPRTQATRKKTRLRGRLKTARARLRSATHEKHRVRRTVTRRDAQIARERDTHASREKKARAELRLARRAARTATRARDQAIAFAEEQERARQAADRRADAEALARAAADAEVVRLRAELQAAQDAAKQDRGSRERAPSPQTKAIPRGPAAPCMTAGGARPSQPVKPSTAPAAASPRETPNPEIARLREILARRDAEHETTRSYVARMEEMLQRTHAQRDAALAEAARRKQTLDRVVWAVGTAGALALVVRKIITARSDSGDTPTSANVSMEIQRSCTSLVAQGFGLTSLYRGSEVQDVTWSAGPLNLRSLGDRPSGTSSA